MAHVVSLGDRLTFSVHFVDKFNLLRGLDILGQGKLRDGAVVLGLNVEQLRGVAAALGERRVLQVHVSRQEELVAGEAPHVEVIDGSDSRKGKNITANDISSHFFGRALHEIVYALHEGGDGREHDEDREKECAERINNLPVGLVHDDNGGNDDTDRLQKITNEMRDGSLNVDVLGLVVMMMVIVIMVVVMVMSMLVAMAAVTVIMMMMMAVIVSMFMLVVVSLAEALEELVSRFHLVLCLDVTGTSL